MINPDTNRLCLYQPITFSTSAAFPIGAGEWGHEIILAPQNLVQAAQATVVNLTDRGRPVFEESGS